MYPFVSHTINFIKGECPHNCDYCFMKRFPVGDLRLDEKEFKTDLGNDNFIFVGSSCDTFARDIPSDWIWRSIKHCEKYPRNKYLFQSKNPMRFVEFCFPKKTILGTTIESNRVYDISKAPSVVNRYIAMKHYKMRKMLSLEPLLKFDLEILVRWIREIDPEFVSIGADSKNHNLPEPHSEKVRSLVEELKEFTEVRLKKNLKRLL